MNLRRLHGLPKAVAISLIMHSVAVIAAYVIIERRPGVEHVTIPFDLVTSSHIVRTSEGTITGRETVLMSALRGSNSPLLPAREIDLFNTFVESGFRTPVSKNVPTSNMSRENPLTKPLIFEQHIKATTKPHPDDKSENYLARTRATTGSKSTIPILEMETTGLQEELSISDAPSPLPLPTAKPQFNRSAPAKNISTAKLNSTALKSLHTPSYGKTETVLKKGISVDNLKQAKDVEVQEEEMLTAAIVSSSGGNVITPMPGNLPPSYPAQARRKGYEGQVLLTVRVASAGHVLDVAIARSSGFALLDNAALAAVRHWRFNSISDGSEPTNVVVQLPITFRLDEHSSLRK